MGTSALICVPVEGKIYKAIRLGSDGYPSHAKEILNKYYADLASAEELIQGGNISFIGKYYSPNPLGLHNLNDCQPNVTRVYLRDNTYENLSEENLAGAAHKIINITEWREHYEFIDYIYKYNPKLKKWVEVKRD